MQSCWCPVILGHHCRHHFILLRHFQASLGDQFWVLYRQWCLSLFSASASSEMMNALFRGVTYVLGWGISHFWNIVLVFFFLPRFLVQHPRIKRHDTLLGGVYRWVISILLVVLLLLGIVHSSILVRARYSRVQIMVLEWDVGIWCIYFWQIRLD